jgi:hypothetical protein
VNVAQQTPSRPAEVTAMSKAPVAPVARLLRRDERACVEIPPAANVVGVSLTSVQDDVGVGAPLMLGVNEDQGGYRWRRSLSGRSGGLMPAPSTRFVTCRPKQPLALSTVARSYARTS